jgi:hypothetical protein
MLFISFTFHKVGDYGVETDFFWGYVPAAKEFLEGTIKIDAFRGPLYPIFLALFGLILPDYFTAGVMIGIISASIVIYFSFELLRKLFSQNLAIATVLLLMVNSIFIQYTYSAGTDMFFNALATATLYFFFKDEKLNIKILIIAAVLGGLSYLTRYNAIFLISFVVIIFFVNYSGLKLLEKVKYSVLFIVVFMIIILPWGIYCLNEKGSFFYNENYKNIAYEIYGKNKISWDEYWFKESTNVTSLTEVIFEDPGLFLSTISKNVGDNFIQDMEKLLGWHLGVFVIAGLVLVLASNPLKNWESRETASFISNLFFFALLLLIFYSERFSLFLIPFYFTIALQPFFISKFRVKKFIPEKFGYALMIGLIIFTFAKSYSYNKERINSGPTELLELREWFNKNIPENQRGKKIAARKAHVAYYLDLDFGLLPMADSYNELLIKLREMKADYLYFSPIEAAMRQEFYDLLNPKVSHAGLKVLVYFNNPPAVLYQVMKE